MYTTGACVLYDSLCILYQVGHVPTNCLPLMLVLAISASQQTKGYLYVYMFINILQFPQIIFDANVVNTFFDTENIRSRALLGDFTTSIGKILSETNWKKILLEGGGGD